jgi:hypothetical protein
LGTASAYAQRGLMGSPLRGIGTVASALRATCHLGGRFRLMLAAAAVLAFPGIASAVPVVCSDRGDRERPRGMAASCFEDVDDEARWRLGDRLHGEGHDPSGGRWAFPLTLGGVGGDPVSFDRGRRSSRGHDDDGRWWSHDDDDWWFRGHRDDGWHHHDPHHGHDDDGCSPVPEPGTLLLLAGGLPALRLARRRRSR